MSTVRERDFSRNLGEEEGTGGVREGVGLGRGGYHREGLVGGW